MSSAVFLVGTACAVAVAATPSFINPGTPAGITQAFDCKARDAAFSFGKQLLPKKGGFKRLYDALQLQVCGVPTPPSDTPWKPEQHQSNGGQAFYVDASKGQDTNPGDIGHPFKTIGAAVAAARGCPDATVNLRAGTYYTNTVTLSAANNGLTIQSYNGEVAIVSGAVPLSSVASASAWREYKIKNATEWQEFVGQNNVYGQAHSRNDTATIKYIGSFDTLAECEAGLASSPKGPFKSFTFHEPSFKGDFSRQCFGVTVDHWAPRTEANIISGRKGKSQNTWVATLSKEDAGLLPEGIKGLRFNGGLTGRAIRAKFPDGNMELSGNWLSGANPGMGGGEYFEGWFTDTTVWVPPFRHSGTQDLVANDADWPSVEWPHYEGSQTGEGDQGDFHIGMGGYCQDDLQDSVTGPTGYWCALNPPRGQCWDNVTNVGRGCTQTHMSPDGIQLARATNYSDPTTGVITSWRGGGRWFSQRWKVASYVAANQTLIFDPTTGGQGGEGMTNAKEWYIENILEECDSADEFFYDQKTSQLYFNPNGTAGTAPTGSEAFEATRTRILFNISGTQDAPVKGVTIRGLHLRDTQLTYADAHGMPSGGDWGLARNGAIFLEGTEDCAVDGNLMTRLDGNGVFLSQYNRRTNITNNEVGWIGASAFAAWGSTSGCINENCSVKIPYPVGPDGRSGNQPRSTLVEGNLVYEIGIWQKQSSMWFQAVSAQNTLRGNVHFNGPRAGINFNDGFGGGDVVELNLLANCVRESGDHGPFNSWDRVPYITNVRTGNASVIPQWREIRHNFMLSVYSSQEAIDTDDGSAYYKTHDNFFVYAANGLKSDFNGHDNRHYDNVYGYVSNCWGSGNNNWFVGNDCFANSDTGGFRSDCKPGSMEIYGNTIYNRNGTLSEKICNTSNKVQMVPSDDDIIAAGMAKCKAGLHLLHA